MDFSAERSRSYSQGKNNWALDNAEPTVSDWHPRSFRQPMRSECNTFEYSANKTVRGDFVYTVSAPEVVAPVIAYNLNEGSRVAMPSMLTIVKVPIGRNAAKHPRSDVGPVMGGIGRRDSTASVMEANVYREGVEDALYGRLELARSIRLYCLRAVDLDPRLEISIPDEDWLVDQRRPNAPPRDV